MRHAKSSRKVKGKRRVLRRVLFNRMSQEDTEDLIIGDGVESQKRVCQKVYGGFTSENTLFPGWLLRMCLGRDLVGKKRRSSLAVYKRRTTSRGHWAIVFKGAGDALTN